MRSTCGKSSHFVALTASIHSENSDSEHDEAEFDEEVLNYFNGGLITKIFLFLSERHEHPSSYSTLLRRLKKYSLEMRGVTEKEEFNTFCELRRRMAELINGPWSSVQWESNNLAHT